MNTNSTSLSRRSFLGLAASGAAALSTTDLTSRAAESTTTRSTVRDHLWIFTTPPGSSNNFMESGNVRGGSRMTPAEGAFYLNVPNLILVRNRDLPPLPDGQQWRAKTDYEQYAIAFRPLKKVVWSVVGSSGKGGMNELHHVLGLAKKFPNISGIYLDDFIVDWWKKRSDGRRVGRPAVMPQEIRDARDKMKAIGRPLDIWLTLYTREVSAKHPQYVECEPPLAGFLDLFDVLTLWTWNGNELHDTEEHMASLETMAPKKRKVLGLYMWDYPNKRPMPLDLMKFQCDLGLKWLKQGRVSDLIFLTSTICDMGLPSVEFARQWIADVSSEAI